MWVYLLVWTQDNTMCIECFTSTAKAIAYRDEFVTDVNAHIEVRAIRN